MERKIRVAVMGTGLMARNCVRFVVERGGCEIVAAIGRKNYIDEDIGELSGIGTLDVKVEKSTDLKSILERTNPDIVCDCGSGWPTTIDILRTTVGSGYNTIALAEEAYYCKAEDLAVFEELDTLAKKNGVSVIGLGMQDVNWSHRALINAANCHKLNRIVGENWCVLDFAGPSEFGRVGLNLTEEEFYKYHSEDPNPSNAYTFSLYEIADEMGLTVTEELNDKTTPIFAEEDYVSKILSEKDASAYGGTILKGKTQGSRRATTLKTKEGIDIVGVFFYTFLVPGAAGKDVWRFEGEPTFEVVVEEGRYDIGTSTDVVNRIPDVINARSGYITVKDLPKPIYHVGPLNQYVIS